jgi:methyltransferase
MQATATSLILIAAGIFSFMALEARRAARNEGAQRARGGIEPRGDVYHVMRVAYPGAFLAMLAEGMIGGVPPGPIVAVGVALFAAAKTLKWWAIVSLGSAWTFRVIVVPGQELVTAGPYRVLRHPNYVAVAGELVATALMTGARVSGPIATALFSLLMLRRISVENRALGAILPK